MITSPDVSASNYNGYIQLKYQIYTNAPNYVKKGSTTPDTPETPKTLSEIRLSGMTTIYDVDDVFIFDGTCTAYYSDDSTKEVTPTYISSPDMSTSGTKAVTISYTEGGVTKTAKYTVTVGVVLKSISITGSYKTSYEYGQEFSTDGIVITALYSDNSTIVVTDDCVFTGYS